MKTEKDVQVEDSQTLETPQPDEKTSEPQAELKKRTFVQIALPWVIVSLAFLLIGAGVVFFTLYQPLTKELATARSEAADLSTQLSTAQVDLEKAKTDLNTTQLSLTDTQASLETEKIATLLYKLQTDINAARVALLKLDPSSARQALTFASADLADLSQTKIGADKLSGLQERIDTALTNLESDPQKAVDSLDTLYTNLLLITNNLK
jgi:septation ring formation regulator EzrA